jgi:hypothetical protein
MKRIVLIFSLALAAYASAAERTISAMTLQGKIWYRCTAMETGKRHILSWSIDDLSDASGKQERIVEKRISKEDFDALVLLLKKSEDFRKNNQTKPDGGVGLSRGFIIALREGPLESPTFSLTFDLPPELQSNDLIRFKEITKWEDIKSLTSR